LAPLVGPALSLAFIPQGNAPLNMLQLVLWFAVVLGGIGVMQWGASCAADLLERIRDRYALPATAGGALMALATASPETAVNVASVVFGWPDLGLGAALGSNIPALPFAFGLAYIGGRYTDRNTRKPSTLSEDGTPTVKPQAVPVQVLPYLGIVLLLAALTLPPGWAGLQPIDGAILLLAWAVFFGRAVWRKPWRKPDSTPAPLAARKAVLLGLPAVALGAVSSVYAAQKVGTALGWSDLVVGLFAIGFLCALPESYSAFRFAREGKPTLAVSGATADGIVSLSIALLPPALIGATVGNYAVYIVNIGFLISVLSIYAMLNHKSQGQELGPGFVSLFLGLYGGYVALMAWLLSA
jgi:cation:H+ antiporter